MMKAFRDRLDTLENESAMSLALGTVSGLIIGALASRALAPRPPRRMADLSARARTAVRRFGPARLRRIGSEQEALDRLEEKVLRRFLNDNILCERGVDIGAISPGIVELSGSVWTDAEMQRAVDLANQVDGVRTVVNRLEVEGVLSRDGSRRRQYSDLSSTFGRQGSRTGGMGRRRQALETDPDRRDDSQTRREDALAAADRDQWSDEGFAPAASRMNARPEVQPRNRTNFSEGELDNQDPHRQHAKRTLDRPPEDLNTSARVGEGEMPGLELRAEEGGSRETTEPRRARED